jgi:hypothetical protein
MTIRLVSDDERRTFLGYISAVFALPTTEDVADALRDLNPPKPFSVRMKVVYSREGVLDVFLRLAQRGIVERLHPGGPGFAFRILHGLKSEDAVFLAILPTSQSHVSVIVSVAEREEWISLLRAVRKEYPTIVPVYLSQRELLQGVGTLRKRVSATHELRVRELSAKETFQTSGGKRVRSLRAWTDEEWEGVVSDVSERRQVVTRATLAFYRRIGDKTDIVPSAMCKVTKRGEIEFDGRYDLIWDTVVRHVAEAGESKLAFYSKRGLRDRGYKPAPLEIRYRQPVFDQVEEVRRLVAVLARYPHAMHSVQHGNPYAYVQIADTYDGSGFDVWALSPTRITVVPRLKSTEAALDRLIQYIFDEFREGVVGNVMDKNEDAPGTDVGTQTPVPGGVGGVV